MAISHSFKNFRRVSRSLRCSNGISSREISDLVAKSSRILSPIVPACPSTKTEALMVMRTLARRPPTDGVRVPVAWLTTLAISGEAHRDGQGYHVGRILVMCTGSELSVAGFVRFIAGLAGSLVRSGVPQANFRQAARARD